MPGRPDRPSDACPSRPGDRRALGVLDKTHFSRLFRATYGLSPQAYREQNGGEASP
ncbi:helix-turn-helix transcriptional regulator [Micromonospora chersina]|uniref:helix-turn-helix transcriptional regulator n=1 Tax=Micromonospora chersina TaxID=47854 RepID=UPI0033C2565B